MNIATKLTGACLAGALIAGLGTAPAQAESPEQFYKSARMQM